jgi:hypothetical protein
MQACLKFILEGPKSHYRVSVGGGIIEGEALNRFILNAGSIGRLMGMDIPEVGDVAVNDGW